jgi:hypothetical protein
VEYWFRGCESVGVCIQEGFIIRFGWHILAFGDRSGIADILWSTGLGMAEYTLFVFVAYLHLLFLSRVRVTY